MLEDLARGVLSCYVKMSRKDDEMKDENEA